MPFGVPFVIMELSFSQGFLFLVTSYSFFSSWISERGGSGISLFFLVGLGGLAFLVLWAFVALLIRVGGMLVIALGWCSMFFL